MKGIYYSTFCLFDLNMGHLWISTLISMSVVSKTHYDPDIKQLTGLTQEIKTMF